MNDLNRRLISGLKSTAIISLIALGVQYGITLILARQSAQTLGVYSLLIMLTTFVATFFVVGGNVFAPFFAELKTEAEKFGLALLYFAGVCIFAGIGFAVARYVDLATTVKIFTEINIGYGQLAALVVAVVLVIFFSNVENSRMNIRRAALIQRAPQFALIAILILALLFGRKIAPSNVADFVTIAWAVAALPLLWGLCQYFRRSSVRVWSDGRMLREFGGYILFVQMSTMSVFFYDNIERWLITERIEGATLMVLGVYAAAQQINLIILGVGRQASFALFPAFSYAIEDRGQLKNLFVQSTRFSVLIMGGGALVLICLARPVLSFYGSEYSSYSGLLMILLVTTTVQCIGSITSAMLFALKKTKIFMFANGIMVLLYAGLGYWLVPRLGIYGIAVAQLIAVICLHSFLLVFLSKSEGLRPPRQFLILILLAVISGVIAYGFEAIWQNVAVLVVAMALFLGSFGFTREEIARLRRLFLD